jgi:hypothetical protein
MTDVSRTGYCFHLLADLSRDPALRDRLADDPSAVLGQYSVPPDKQAILRGRNIEQIVHMITREAHDLIIQLREQPRISPIPWGGSQVEVKSVHPPRGPTHDQLTLEIRGTWFDDNAQLTFTCPQATVSGTVVSVHTEPDGHSAMTAKALFTVAATYDVTVTNPDSGEYGPLSSGFIAFDR